jgi:hypothetical protein
MSCSTSRARPAPLAPIRDDAISSCRARYAVISAPYRPSSTDGPCPVHAVHAPP